MSFYDVEWPYDDYSWWVDAIHQSTCPMRDLELAEPALKIVTSGSCDPAELDSSYTSVLRHIADGQIPDDRVVDFLFRAKALRKWKFADAAFEAERKEEAIAGFLERNAEAADAGLVPWPYNVAMRRILRQWLPLCERDVIGNLGPLEKACAEKYTSPCKLRRFASWCGSVRLPFQRFPREGRPADGLIRFPEVPLDHPDSGKDTGRLCAVPKTRDKDRLITVEPLYRKYAQQWVRQMLQESIHSGPLRGSCMDLGYVDGAIIQRRLALEASRSKTLATIDLKDASDRITLEQVLDVFPPWACHLLGMTRCEYVKRDDDVRKYPLRIYAGMGNATTFTVETLFFSAFVKAYAWAHGLRTRVSVFGDDVICSSEVAAKLMEENFSFFKINRDKSFVGADRLRESCGIFAYEGLDVTVPKVDGFRNSIEGRMGIVDLHKRMKMRRESCFQRLSYLIAKPGILVNWPFVVEGYPSLDDERFEYDALPETRWDVHNQIRRAKVMLRQAGKVCYVADSIVSRRRNTDGPLVWYWASLAGLASGDPRRVTSPGDVRRNPASTFSFPNGKFRMRPNWAPIHPSDWMPDPGPSEPTKVVSHSAGAENQ